MRGLARIQRAIRRGLIRPLEALHQQPDLLLFRTAYRSRTTAAGAGIEPALRNGQITQRGRKPNPPRHNARKPLQPFQKAQHLHAAHIAHKIVHLINDDKAQVVKQLDTCAALMDEQGFQRFGCNLQNSLRMLQKPILLRLRGVPMPFANR